MINILAADIAEYFYSFLVPFVRISAFTISAPIFTVGAFNIRFRIMVAVMLTLLAINVVEFNAQVLSIDQLITNTSSTDIFRLGCGIYFTNSKWRSNRGRTSNL